MDKQALKERQQQILSLIRGFCTEKLNEEYYTLSEKLIQKLGARKILFLRGGRYRFGHQRLFTHSELLIFYTTGRLNLMLLLPTLATILEPIKLRWAAGQHKFETC